MHPLIVRKILFPLHEAVLCRPTRRFARELEASQWWPTDRLRELQTHKIRRLLNHIRDRIPYLARRIGQAGIDPNRFTLGDLPRLPTLTKSEINANLDQLIDPTVAGGLHRSCTGGSTGAPLTFYMDRFRQAADQAARIRSRRWFGIEPGERELYLWGSPVELRAQDRLKCFRDRLGNHRLLDAFRMTPQRMSAYLSAIQRFDPKHIFGYPSSLAQLVRHAQAGGSMPQLRSLSAVFVTGELLVPADRAVLEEAFGVPVADGYGSREAGFIAHQCPEGGYHVSMENVIVELLDANGNPSAPGQTGEIVVTHLDAVAMPFIRYRTGDLARRNDSLCPCGRKLELLEAFEGRRTDMLQRPGGGWAHALSVIYVLREEAEVAEFKIIQRSDLTLDVFVAPRGRLSAECRGRIEQGVRRQIGGEVRVRQVNAIPPEPSGKHRYVVSEATTQAAAHTSDLQSTAK